MPELRAPYNFVSLHEKVFLRYDNPSEMPGHDKHYQGTCSGLITYTLKALTPVMVGKGKPENADAIEFYQDSRGRYAIPGNSVRGMIRTNLLTLGACKVKNDIENQRFMFRVVADGQRTGLAMAYRKGLKIVPDNRGRNTPGNVQAGVVEYLGANQYKIHTCNSVDGHAYYRVNERFLRSCTRLPEGVSFMYNINIPGYTHDDNLTPEEKRNAWFNFLWANRSYDYQNDKCDYHPYSVPVSFERVGETITEIARSDCNLTYKGYLMGSGFIKNKFCHYLFNQESEKSKTYKISEQELRDFEDDYRNKFNTIRENADFFALPQMNVLGQVYCQNDTKKPIFFAPSFNNQPMHFGFTPFMRIFHQHRVHDGIHEDSTGFDYAQSIFGFAGNKDKVSLKSRVSFQDCVLQGENNTRNGVEPVQYVVGQPSATCFAHYVVQDANPLKHYSSETFTIRGKKHYWFRSNPSPDLKALDACKNEKLKIRIRPLPSGSEFKGQIRFHNLFPDELGLLLWSLKLEEKSCQSVGMCKQFGYGQMKVHSIEVVVDLPKQKYGPTFMLNDYTSKLSEDESKALIDQFKDKMSRELYPNANLKFNELTPVRELMFIKREIVKMQATDSVYLTLKEYQAKTPLPNLLPEYRTNTPLPNLLPEPQRVDRDGPSSTPPHKPLRDDTPGIMKAVTVLRSGNENEKREMAEKIREEFGPEFVDVKLKKKLLNKNSKTAIELAKDVLSHETIAKGE